MNKKEKWKENSRARYKGSLRKEMRSKRARERGRKNKIK